MYQIHACNIFWEKSLLTPHAPKEALSRRSWSNMKHTFTPFFLFSSLLSFLPSLLLPSILTLHTLTKSPLGSDYVVGVGCVLVSWELLSDSLKAHSFHQSSGVEKSEIKLLADPYSLWGTGWNPCSFWWWSAVPHLQQHHCSLCLHHHLTFTLGVSLFTLPWTVCDCV